jgi:hypothetical protein
MKKLILLFAGLITACTTLFAQDTIVYWNFFATPYDTLADGGDPINSLALVSRDTSFHNNFSYSAGALPIPDKSISSNSWANGNGVKNYMIGFSTSSYNDIVFYSKQRSSGTGPKYFKVQYRITGTGVWTDVTGANVTCADNFLSGVLAGISLPVACNNQPDLYLRWVMTSDSSVGGALVGANGTSRLDEVFILSTTYVGVSENKIADHYAISPNPCEEFFTLKKNHDEAVRAEIIDITGKIIYNGVHRQRSVNVTVAGLKGGLYL